MSLQAQSAKLFALPIELKAVTIKPKVPWTELFAASIKLFLPCAELFGGSILLEVVSIQLLVECAKQKAQSTELYLSLSEVCETSISHRA
jgi:hypothetical protein